MNTHSTDSTVWHTTDNIVWGEWTRRTDCANKMRVEYQDEGQLDAGYCLDALESFPAGGMYRYQLRSSSFGGIKQAYREPLI